MEEVKTYTVYKPDYECPESLGTFGTKELAIKYIRMFYPCYLIYEIDEKNDKLDFGYNCFIKENLVFNKLPKMFLHFYISFDDYNNNWIGDFEIHIESKDYNDEKIMEEKTNLSFQKIMNYTQGMNPKEEFNKYYDENITSRLKKYKGVIKVSDDDYIEKSKLFLGKSGMVSSIKNIQYNEKDVLKLESSVVIFSDKGIEIITV